MKKILFIIGGAVMFAAAVFIVVIMNKREAWFN